MADTKFSNVGLSNNIYATGRTIWFNSCVYSTIQFSSLLQNNRSKPRVIYLTRTIRAIAPDPSVYIFSSADDNAVSREYFFSGLHLRGHNASN